MSMTKKDYELVAKHFRELLESCDDYYSTQWLSLFITDLADDLKKHNEKFKRDLFLKQCGVDNE